MLILIAWILIYICQINRRKKNTAFVDSTLYVILFGYFVTELYSRVHLLKRNVIIFAWGCLCILSLFFILTCKKKTADYYEIRNIFKDKEYLKTRVVLGIIGVGILFLSAKSITANWDSMSYHMPRIMHWIQNATTAFYATSELRQITSPPLAEYLVMQVMMLTGNDKFVCVVQGMSYLLSARLVYIISCKMKMSKKYAYLAVFLFMMMPPAIAEAVTTQNDLFAALILLIFFYYYLDFIYCDNLTLSRENLFLSAKTGVTIALGYLAKSYVLIPMGILIIYLGGKTILRKEKVKNIVVICGVGIGTAVIGILPFFLENYRVYGSLLPKSQTDGIMPETFAPTLLIANCYKNVAQYFSTPYLVGFNEFLEKIGRGIEKLFRIDLNNAAIAKTEFHFPDSAGVYHHDLATNPVIMFLGTLVFLGILFKICKKSKLEEGMFFCITVGILVTAALSKYSIWKVRYFLAVSAVAVIFIAFFIEGIQDKYKWKETFIGIVLCLSFLNGYGALKYTKDAVQMGYYGNEDGDYSYFVNYKIRGNYNDISDYIGEKGFKEIGLYLQGNSYEYPLWVYLDQATRIEHVLVEDEYLSKLEDLSFIPDCIISIDKGECFLNKNMEYHGCQYVCQYVSLHDTQYGIFVKKGL